MKAMTVGDLKSRFSEVIQEVKADEEIAVAFEKKEIVAYLIPKSSRKSANRRPGILGNKGRVIFSDEFNITEDAFLGL